jgi:integrase
VLATTRVNRPGLSPEYQLACKWVPWLLAYTGARVGEIAQLRAEDVRQDGEHWVLTLTPEAGNVKTNEFRLVPLHPHLVEMGFPAVATAKKTGPLFYAPERRETKTGSKPLSDKVGEKLRAAVREAGVKIAQPNHAWRHRFKTKARLHGLDLQAADVLQGHASDTEGQRYGVWPIPRLAAEVAKLPRYVVPSD